MIAPPRVADRNDPAPVDQDTEQSDRDRTAELQGEIGEGARLRSFLRRRRAENRDRQRNEEHCGAAPSRKNRDRRRKERRDRDLTGS